MAGLDPAIFRAVENDTPSGGRAMLGGWVYVMTNRRDGTLYIGVTSDLAKRIREHREGVVEGFTKKHRLKRLVWAERHDNILSAIQRLRTRIVNREMAGSSPAMTKGGLADAIR